MEFLISFQAQRLPLRLETDFSTATIGDLKQCIADSYPTLPDTFRLVFKSKTLAPDTGLLSAYFPAPSASTTAVEQAAPYKLMLLGSSSQAIDRVHTADQKHRESSLAYERALRTSKPSNNNNTVATPASQSASQYTCLSLEALPEFSNKSTALALLDRVRNDWGIRAIMQKYRWTVGVLKELHPNEDASILGYNRNKGQVIALRLRTNALDGFRNFKAIRSVMVHELTHMIHSEHNADFHALNRQLSKEVDALNHGETVGERGETYASTSSASRTESGRSFEGGVYVLGGGQLAASIQAASATPASDQSGAAVHGDRPSRELLAAAVMLRLTKEEKEITDGCSTQH